MRILFAILGGFSLTLATFGGGFVAAIAFLNAEPVPARSPLTDTTEVWTIEPRRVDTAERDLTRLPPDTSSDASTTGVQAKEASEDRGVASDDDNVIDMTTTAAVAGEVGSRPEPAVDSEAKAAHVAWCSERYRSYRPETNSYTPYSGGQRECVSPYVEALPGGTSSIVAESSSDRPFVGNAKEDEPAGNHVSAAHIKSCFARYRSYRPEDNSYQPYGGGPRRQCR